MNPIHLGICKLCYTLVGGVSFLFFVACLNPAPALEITFSVPETSELLINASESDGGVANVIGIIGGKGLRNSYGRSRNYLVKQKHIFVQSGLNFYLLPNRSNKELAEFPLRNSRKRAKRILALVRAIRNRSAKPVFIVGFSRGSVDAGTFAKLYPDEIAGIAIVSGVYTNTSRKAEAYSMELVIGQKIDVPVVVAHHEEDACTVTPFWYAKSFFDSLKAPSKSILSYRGGSGNGRACGPLNHHGFEGIEEMVAQDLSNWVLKVSTER